VTADRSSWASRRYAISDLAVSIFGSARTPVSDREYELGELQGARRPSPLTPSRATTASPALWRDRPRVTCPPRLPSCLTGADPITRSACRDAA
jgi:hypothetical protein